MIRAIFKDKRMVGYATVGYYSSDPDEVVVELTEEQIKQIVGTEDWQDIYHTLFLENEDAEIGENLLPSLGDSKILPTEVANTQFRLLDDISEEELAFIMSKFPSFEIGKSYLVNEKVVFRSKLYKVIQGITLLKLIGHQIRFRHCSQWSCLMESLDRGDNPLELMMLTWPVTKSTSMAMSMSAKSITMSGVQTAMVGSFLRKKNPEAMNTLTGCNQQERMTHTRLEQSSRTTVNCG